MKVRSQASDHPGCPGDEVRVVFVCYGPPPRIGPDDRHPALLVRFEDQPGSFRQHLSLELAAGIDSVAHPQDPEAGALTEADELFYHLPLAAHRVAVLGFDQVGLAI